jgi:hypothetical protein
VTRPVQSPLARLWAEFTDPGPRGDALVFLKNHLDGIGPGCMGLLFMAVGVFVAILGLKTGRAAGKTWVPILFGCVFALAGFGAALVGAKAILGKGGKGKA